MKKFGTGFESVKCVKIDILPPKIWLFTIQIEKVCTWEHMNGTYAKMSSELCTTSWSKSGFESFCEYALFWSLKFGKIRKICKIKWITWDSNSYLLWSCQFVALRSTNWSTQTIYVKRLNFWKVFGLIFFKTY